MTSGDPYRLLVYGATDWEDRETVADVLATFTKGLLENKSLSIVHETMTVIGRATLAWVKQFNYAPQYYVHGVTAVTHELRQNMPLAQKVSVADSMSTAGIHSALCFGLDRNNDPVWWYITRQILFRRINLRILRPGTDDHPPLVTEVVHIPRSP